MICDLFTCLDRVGGRVGTRSYSTVSPGTCYCCCCGQARSLCKPRTFRTPLRSFPSFGKPAPQFRCSDRTVAPEKRKKNLPSPPGKEKQPELAVGWLKFCWPSSPRTRLPEPAGTCHLPCLPNNLVVTYAIHFNSAILHAA